MSMLEDRSSYIKVSESTQDTDVGEVSPTYAYYNGSCTSKDNEDPSWSTSFKTRRQRRHLQHWKRLGCHFTLLYLYLLETLKYVRDESNVLLQEQWDRCNSIVLSWILGCIFQDLYQGQIFSKIAKSVWDEFKETDAKIDGFVIYNLHYKICSLTQSGSSLSKYYHNYNSIWRQFDSLVDLPSCSCDSATKLKDHRNLMRLMQFLMGFNDTYSVVRSQILTSEPLPDVKSTFSTLSRVESHKNNLVHTSSTRPSSSDFISRPNNWSNNRNTQSRVPSRNTSLVYKHCHMTRHTIDRCYELNRYPPGFKKRNQGGSNVSNNVSGSSIKPDQRYKDSLQKSLVRTDSEKNSLYKFDPDKLQIDSLDDIQPCDVCHKAKQTREPFPISDHKTKCLGDIIHLDVWGPYEVKSREGFRVDEVFHIWKAFGRITHELDSFGEETDKTTDLHQHCSRISLQWLDTASQIQRDTVTTKMKTKS
ncbi:hypothetical protein Tco_0295881 [Tanacetum coccineum]